LEEVSIGKSVPNLISYLHDFFQNFCQSLATCFELFSFREFVYSEIADSGPHLTVRRCRVNAMRRASQQHASRPPDSAPHLPCRRRRRQRPPRPRRPPPDSVAPRPTASLAPLAFRQSASPTALSPRPPPCRPNRLARRSPVAVTLRRRLRADEPPFPTVSHASAPCRRRLVEQRHRRAARRQAVPPTRARARAMRRVGRPSWAAHAAPAEAVGRTRGPCPHCASGSSAVSAPWHPVKFYYFLIYSIHCKFKNV
jgi:hypothetical protein